MFYRLIGSATTDSSGVATINYTGKGNGRINLIASNTNPITSSSLVSNSYEVLDTINYDEAITGHTKKTYWYLNRGNMTIAEGDDGTTITDSNSSGYGVAVLTLTENPSNVNDSYIYDTPVCFEFDIISFTTGGGVRIYDKTNNHAPSFPNIVSENNHVKVEVTGNKVIYYCDGQTSEANYTPNAKVQIGFRINNSTSLKFKNFYIYPI